MPRTARFDTVGVALTANAQAGVITARQLAELGVSRSVISDRSRPGGMWSRILPGVHLLSRGDPTPLQRDVAALLFAGGGSVLTGLSALRHMGMASPHPESSSIDTVHVLVPHHRRRISTSFVRIERTRAVPPTRRTPTDPALPMSVPARAVIDAARHMRDRQEVFTLVVDSVGRGLATPDDLRHEVTRAARQGSSHVRRAIDAVSAGAWSAPEGDLRPLIERAGLPEPCWNQPLLASDGRVIAIPDAFIDDVALAIEVDSAQHHSSGRDWDRTVRRQAAYAQAGVLCLPITPLQIATDPEGVVRALRAAYAQAAARPRPLVTSGRVVVRDPAAGVSVRWAG